MSRQTMSETSDALRIHQAHQGPSKNTLDIHTDKHTGLKGGVHSGFLDWVYCEVVKGPPQRAGCPSPAHRPDKAKALLDVDNAAVADGGPADANAGGVTVKKNQVRSQCLFSL